MLRSKQARKSFVCKRLLHYRGHFPRSVLIEIRDTLREPFANDRLEMRRAQREMERVKRISRPVWLAARSVASSCGARCFRSTARIGSALRLFSAALSFVWHAFKCGRILN
jgi:hypothetical protein